MMNQHINVLRNFLNAEIERDLESMAVCLHDEFTLHVVGVNELIQGKSNFLSVMQKVFRDLKDWDLGVVRTIEDKNSIAVEFNGSGHFSGEFEGKDYLNVPIKIQSVCVFDFEDGLIKKCAEYYDSQMFKQQLVSGG